MYKATFLRFPTFLNTVFAEKYKEPQKYHDYVVEGGRILLANHIAQGLAENISDKENALVLDLAAGTGIVSNALVEKGFRVLATDHYQEMLDKINTHENLETRLLDYNKNFELVDEMFEGVTNLWGNRYIQNVEHFLREIFRVLKPGGVFYWPIFAIEVPVWIKISHPEILPTKKNLESLSKRVGFEVRGIPQKNPLSAKVPGFLILKKSN